MAEHPAGRIINAVRGEDHAFLRGLPGLGKKTAERLVMELKDKLEDVAAEPAPGEPAPALRDEAMLALMSLGMPRQTAQRVLEKMDWSTADSTNLESIIKEALRHTSSV
jgi:Holliday junction DNA helicase RuvA